MKKHITSKLIPGCLLGWLLFALRAVCQAQRLHSVNGQKIKIYTFDVKRLDDVETYRNVLYDISDTSLVFIDRTLLVSAIDKWKAGHGGTFPPADSLTALLTLYHSNFQSLKWVKINKVSGVGIGFLAGIAIAAITILPGDSGYEGIVFLALAPPFSLLGGLVGAAATPQRKFRNHPKYRFKERITQRLKGGENIQLPSSYAKFISNNPKSLFRT